MTMVEHPEMRHPQNELAKEGPDDESSMEVRRTVPSSAPRPPRRTYRGGGRRSVCSGYASAAVIFLCLSGPPTRSEAFVSPTSTPLARTTVSGRPAGLWSSSQEEGGVTITIRAVAGARNNSPHPLRASPTDPDGDSTSGNWSSYREDGGRREGGGGESRFGVRRRIRSVLRASVDEETGAPLESRLGVRRRVRSVLAKAKSRTGIQNSSEGTGTTTTTTTKVKKLSGTGTPLKTTLSGLDVVAEAASIGGLGAVVIDEESGAVDVALDYVPTKKKGGGGGGGDGKVAAPVDANGASKANGTGTVAGATKTSTATTGKTKKSSPASTPSSPVVPPPEPNPEDSFVPARPKAKQTGENASSSSSSSSGYTELDAFKGDVSAAFSMPPPPLPFTLPELNPSQRATLAAGERVQFQADMGREGNGYVVLDVRAPQEVIWDTLLDFQSYPDTIPTVRGVTMYTTVHKPDGKVKEMALSSRRPNASVKPGWDDQSYNDGTRAVLKHGVASVTRAAFTLSKFRLRIAAVHKYRPHPLGDYMVFTLDPTSKNMVLKNAKGVWHTQSNPDGKGEEYTRVWLLCELKVSPLLPQWITDYAAKRAMPRATTWLKPTVEGKADEGQ